MNQINDLTVTVTFTVGLSDLSVSDKVFEQLTNNSTFNMNDTENGEAYDWLVNNISNDDAMECEYEIDNLEIEEES